MRRLLLVMLGSCLLSLTACKGTTVERTLKLTKGEVYREIEFKAARSERTIKVKATSTPALRILVVLADDKADAINALLKKKTPRSLATGEGNVEAKIPAGKAFVVLLQPAEPPTQDVEVQLGVEGL